jgi:hypothetical protein
VPLTAITAVTVNLDPSGVTNDIPETSSGSGVELHISIIASNLCDSTMVSYNQYMPYCQINWYLDKYLGVS